MNAYQVLVGHVHRHSCALSDSGCVPCPGSARGCTSSVCVRMDKPIHDMLWVKIPTGVETIPSAITPPTFLTSLSLPSSYRSTWFATTGSKTDFPYCLTIQYLYQIAASAASLKCEFPPGRPCNSPGSPPVAAGRRAGTLRAAQDPQSRDNAFGARLQAQPFLGLRSTLKKMRMLPARHI